MFYQCPMGVSSFEDMVCKANIRELVEYERYCMEQGLWKAMESCYAKMGYVTDCWIKGGIRDYIEAARISPIPVKHKVWNTLVWKHEDKAVAECLALYESRCTCDGDTVDLSAQVRFHYRLKLQDGLWKILSLTPIYEKDTMFSYRPGGAFCPDRAELKALRPSYANVLLLQKRYGRTPDETLPGEDRPETVAALYEETSKWLGV